MAKPADVGGGQQTIVIKKGGGCFRIIGIAIVVLVLAIVAIIVIVAASGGGSSSSSSKPIAGKLNVPAHVADNLDVTLTGYKLTLGDQVSTPKPGNEYVVAHWRFHNFRSSSTDVADTGFTVQSKGVITNPEFASSLTNNQLDVAGTSLAPGASVNRDIVFQISKGVPAKIIYQPDPTDSNKKVTWTISG